MERFINPFSDYVFKRISGQETEIRQAGFSKVQGNNRHRKPFSARKEKYYASRKAYNDYANTLEYAKKEGRHQAREEEEQKAKLQIASPLKRQGVDIALAAQATGLSIEKTNRL